MRMPSTGEQHHTIEQWNNQAVILTHSTKLNIVFFLSLVFSLEQNGLGTDIDLYIVVTDFDVYCVINGSNS